MLFRRIFKGGFPLPIECEAIGINAKQQDMGPFGLSSQDHKSFEELQKFRFPKGEPHEPCAYFFGKQDFVNLFEPYLNMSGNEHVNLWFLTNFKL